MNGELLFVAGFGELEPQPRNAAAAEVQPLRKAPADDLRQVFGPVLLLRPDMHREQVLAGFGAARPVPYLRPADADLSPAASV